MTISGIFDDIVSKGFNEGINEVVENREIRNSEGIEYGESDIERIEKTADIMCEIFNDEVIFNWENLSVDERASYLNAYYNEAGKALGIDTRGVYVADLFMIYGKNTAGVNCGDGYLGIDIRLVENPANLELLLNTVTHEMRHQFQHDAIRNPFNFSDITQETLNKWAYEFDHYINPAYDLEGYYNQAIERDSRAYAESTVNEYMSGKRKS